MYSQKNMGKSVMSLRNPFQVKSNIENLALFPHFPSNANCTFSFFIAYMMKDNASYMFYADIGTVHVHV